MFQINKIKNYKKLAEAIEGETGYSVKIRVLEKNHIHYEIYDGYDMILGTLCVMNGDISFAPFATSDNAKDCEYIDVAHLVQATDFINLINIFSKMFVEEADTDVRC